VNTTSNPSDPAEASNWISDLMQSEPPSSERDEKIRRGREAEIQVIRDARDAKAALDAAGHTIAVQMLTGLGHRVVDEDLYFEDHTYLDIISVDTDGRLVVTAVHTTDADCISCGIRDADPERDREYEEAVARYDTSKARRRTGASPERVRLDRITVAWPGAEQQKVWHDLGR
jgi:hypothetical protein